LNIRRASSPCVKPGSKRCISSGEHLRASLGELHVGPGFVLPEPAALDRKLEAGAVFLRRTLQFEQKRAVDEFDKDPAVLQGFNGIGDLDQLAGCGFRVSIGTFSGEFRWAWAS
jgi:hypothetical protein